MSHERKLSCDPLFNVSIPRSRKYNKGCLDFDSSNGYWIMGCQDGLRIFDAASSKYPSILGSSVLLAPLPFPSVQDSGPCRPKEDSTPADDNGRQTVLEAVDKVKSLMRCETSELREPVPIEGPGVSCFYHEKRKAIVVHNGCDMKLIASTNGVYPLNGLFQPLIRDCGDAFLLDCPQSDFQILLDSIDWKAFAASITTLVALENVLAFFRAIKFCNEGAPSWRRIIATLPARVFGTAAHVLANFLESITEPVADLELADPLVLQQNGAVVKVAISLLERFKNAFPQEKTNCKILIITDNSELKRLQSFNLWQDRELSPAELAEAGFVHSPTAEHPHRIKHFASSNETEGVFTCTERSENNVARYMRRIIDRGYAPLQARKNVPLDICVSSRTCESHTTPKGESDIRASYVCDKSGWMLTAQSNGTVTLWSTFPFLVQLKFFDCILEPSHSSHSSTFDAQEDSLPWQLINVAMMSEGHPLAATLILSTLTRGDASTLRCHLTEPDCNLFGEAIGDGSSSLRCNYCTTSTPTPTFINARSLGAHLSSSHPEVVQFPDNYVLTEPQFFHDVPIPLVEVQQSVLVYWDVRHPVFVAFGIDAEDKPCIVVANLSCLLASISLPQIGSIPEVQWRTFRLPEFSYDFTVRKLITLSRVSDHDTLVILAANAPSLYFVDLNTGKTLYNLTTDCDSILDLKYARETRQLGILESSSLKIYEVCFPIAVQDTAIHSASGLTPKVLDTMKDLLSANRIPVSSTTCSIPSIVTLVHHAADQGKRPCAVVWPVARSRNVATLSPTCLSSTCTRLKMCYSPSCRVKTASQYLSVSPTEFVLNADVESYVRASPSMAAEIVGSVKPHGTVHVIGVTTDDWLHVLQASSKETKKGWLNRIMLVGNEKQCVVTPVSNHDAFSNSLEHVLANLTPPPAWDKDTMTISMKLDNLYYVSYVRVECDFNINDFVKPSEESACFIAISFVNMDRGADPFTVVKGHTFNLLTTAHSSRKTSNQSVRYKATIRSTALTLTATNNVQLSFPSQSGPEICLRPIAIRLAVFGTRVSHLQHVSVSRRAILDPNRVPNVVKALTELLTSNSISISHRDTAVEVLQGILGSTKNASAMMAQPAVLEALIINGILQCTSAMPSSTVGLFHKLLEVTSKMKTTISTACLGVLPLLASKCVSPMRATEFFELWQKVANNSSPEMAAACISQLEILGKLVHSKTNTVVYEFLRSHLRLQALVMDDGLFSFPITRFPGENKVTGAFGMFGPIPTVRHDEFQNTTITSRQCSMQSLVNQYTHVEMKSSSSGQLVLDLGREYFVTDLTFYPIPDCGTTFVGITHGKTPDSICDLLYSHELNPSKAAFRKSIRPIKCRFLSLQFASSDFSAASTANPYSTPPNNLGYVQSQMNDDGEITFTPVKHLTLPKSKSDNSLAADVDDDDDDDDGDKEEPTPIPLPSLPQKQAEVTPVVKLQASQKAPLNNAAAPKPTTAKKTAVPHWMTSMKHSQTPIKPPQIVSTNIGLGICIGGYIDDATSQPALRPHPNATDELLLSSVLQSYEDFKQSLTQHQLQLLILVQNYSVIQQNTDRIKAQYQICQNIQAELYIARWRLFHLLMTKPHINIAQYPVLRSSTAILEEIIASCESERNQYLITSILHHVISCCSSSAVATTSLSKFPTVLNFYSTFCVGKDAQIQSLTLELFSKFCKLTVNAWGKLLISSIEQHLGPFAPQGVYQASVFEGLQEIAKTQISSNPTSRNVLLEQILEQVVVEDHVDTRVLEWSLALLHGLLSSSVVETSVQARSNTITIAVIDSNERKVYFKVKPSTPLWKIINAYVTLKQVDRTSLDFKFGGKIVADSANTYQVGLTEASNVLHAVQKGVPQRQIKAEKIESLDNEYEFTGTNDIQEVAIHSDPEASAQILGWLKIGNSFEIHDKRIGWVKIRMDEHLGWINEPENGPSLYSIQTNISEAKLWYRVTFAVPLSGHPVYSSRVESPDTLLGHLHPGEFVQLLSHRGDWVRIQCFGTKNAWTLASKNNVVFLSSEQAPRSRNTVVSVVLRYTDAQSGVQKEVIKSACLLEMMVVLLESFATNTIGCPVQQVAFKRNGQCIPLYLSPAELQIKNGEILEVVSSSSISDPSPVFQLIRFVESDSGDATWLKVGRQTLTCYLVDYYCEKQLLDSKSVTLLFNGNAISSNQSCETLGIENLATMHVRIPATARKQNHIDLQASCCGDEDTSIPTEAIIPLSTFKRLFELLFHPSLCQPLQMSSLFLLTNTIRTLSLNCGYAALMSVLSHPSLSRFLDVVAQSNDVELQEAVVSMMNAIFLQAKKFCIVSPDVFEGASMPTPHPLDQYFSVIKSMIHETLDEIRFCPILGDAYFSNRLPFLLTLLLPRLRTEPKLEVDFHHHMLPFTAYQSNWKCDSCTANFSPANHVRYRCTTCDFDICGNCAVFQVPDLPFRLLEAEELCELFGIFEEINFVQASTLQSQTVCILLTLARSVDPSILASNASFWRALPAVMKTQSRVVEMHARALLRSLLINPLVTNQTRRSLLQSLHRFINSMDTRVSEPKLVLDFIKMIVDSFVLSSSGNISWEPEDLKLLLQSVVEVFKPYMPSRRSSTIRLESLQTGLCAILSMVMRNVCMLDWKYLLWGNIPETSIVSEVTFLINLLAHWEIDRTSPTEAQPPSTRSLTHSHHQAAALKFLHKSSVGNASWNPMKMKPAAGLSAFDDWDLLDWAPASTVNDPFTVAATSASASANTNKPLANSANAVLSSQKNVSSILLHSLFAMVEKLDLLYESLFLTVRFLKQSSISIGNSALLLFCSLLLSRSDDIANQFLLHSDGGLGFLLRQLTQARVDSSGPTSFQQTVTLGSGCAKDTVELGRSTSAFASQILYMLTCICKSRLRVIDHLDLSPTANGKLSSAGKPSMTYFLSAILSFIDSHPTEVCQISKVIALQSPPTREHLSQKLLQPPFSDAKAALLRDVFQSGQTSSPHSIYALSETILCELDISQPGYYRLLNTLISLWTPESLAEGPNFINFLPSIMKLVTHCSMQLSQFEFHTAEAIFLRVVIPWKENGLLNQSTLLINSEPPKVGDRVRLLVGWRPVSKYGGPPSQMIEKGTEGSFTTGGVVFDSIPRKPFSVPNSALEVIRVVSSGTLAPGKFVQILKKVSTLNEQAGFSWPATFDVLIDSVVRVETVNDSQTACRVITPFGLIWVTNDALSSCDVLEDASKQLDTAHLVRNTINLMHQLLICMPSAVSHVIDTLLQVQDAMSCTVSSWLLGLLTRNHPDVVQFLLPSIPSLLQSLEQALETRDEEEVYHALRFWCNATVEPRICNQFMQRNLSHILLQLSGINFQSWPMARSDFLYMISNLCRGNPQLCTIVESQLITSKDDPVLTRALLSSHDEYTFLSISANDQLFNKVEVNFPHEWIDHDLYSTLNSCVFLRVPSHVTLKQIIMTLFDGIFLTNEQSAVFGAEEISIDANHFPIGAHIAFWHSELKEVISGELWAAFPTEAWIRNETGSVVVIPAAAVQRGQILLLPSLLLNTLPDHWMNVSVKALALSQQGDVEDYCRLPLVCHCDFTKDDSNGYCRKISLIPTMPLVIEATNTIHTDLMPRMPCVNRLQETDVIQGLLEVFTAHIERTQAQALVGQQTVRVQDQLSGSYISKNSMSFLVKLLSSVENITLMALKQFAQYLSLLSKLPGFLELVLSSTKCSDTFLSFCGLNSSSSACLRPEFSLASFRDDMDTLLLTLLSLQSNSHCRAKLIEIGLLQQLLKDISVASGFETELADSSNTFQALTKSVFSTAPWVMARTIDNSDGTYTFTPLSNDSFQPHVTGQHVHTGFKSGHNPLLNAAVSAAKTHMDKDGVLHIESKVLQSIVKPPGLVPKSFSGHDDFAIMTRPAIPKDLESDFYFELELVDAGTNSMVGIGLHPPGTISGMVGWEPGSFGYHADDGMVRNCSESKQQQKKFPCQTGDVMGCGWKGDEGFIYFTKNSEIIGGFIVPGNPTFHPVITGADMVRVRLNMGNRPFLLGNREVITRLHMESQQLLEIEAGESPTKSKKRGVGYAEHRSQAETWDATQHESRQLQESRRLQRLLEILIGFLTAEKSEMPEGFEVPILSSSIQSVLSMFLTNDSFTDLCKQSALYLQLFRLVTTMFQWPAFQTLLFDLKVKILKFDRCSFHLQNLAEKFLQFSGRSKQSDEHSPSDGGAGPFQLAKNVIELGKGFTKFERKCQEHGGSEKVATKKLSCPEISQELTNEYLSLLGQSRISSSRILSQWTHSYKEQVTGPSAVPSRKKMSRLAQEMTDAMNSLPCSPSNAMFICVDQDRCDIIKLLVTGVLGTPYSLGCFEFDVYCPPEYPDVAPKFTLCTTGGGSIRFNPNLYANGKVCLSLLGTWTGKGGETWSPASTLLQVYASIQSLIMTDDVYFNEPGYEESQGSDEGNRLNRGYSNIVRYGTLKFGILQQIVSPAPAFANIIRRHFYLQKDAVLNQCQQWLAESREDLGYARYSGLVSTHNMHLADKFKEFQLAYHDAIAPLVTQIQTALASISLPPETEDEDEADD